MATHNAEVVTQTPAQKAGTSFWSTTIRWEEIWKAKWWIVSSSIRTIFMVRVKRELLLPSPPIFIVKALFFK